MLAYEALKAQIDIVDLISRSEPLEKHGSTYRSGHESAGHGSKSGTCLDVCPQKQVYLCRSCGESGDLFSWVMHRRSVSFSEAVAWLCDTYRIPHPRLSPEETARYQRTRDEQKRIRPILREAFQFYHDNMTDSQRNFFRSRGITDETIDELLLGYAPEGNALKDHLKDRHSSEDLYKTGLFFKNRYGATDRYQDRYVFPYWKGGKIVFSIGRSIDPDIEAHKKYVKHLTHKKDREYVSAVAVEHCIYGTDTIRGEKECIITEGIVDAILAIQSGYPCISPITTQFTNRDVERLTELTKRAETIYLINDNEKSGAGLKGALKTAESLFKEGRDVRLVTLPKPASRDKVDLADYLCEHGAEDLRGLMDEAPDFIGFRIQGASGITKESARMTAVKAILATIVQAEPLMQEKYLDLMAKAGLANKSTLNAQMKLEQATVKAEGEKNAVQLADEWIENRYTDGAGLRTLVFHHDVWYEYIGAHYVERSLAEIDSTIVAHIREVGGDVSPYIVNSARLAAYPLVILPNTVDMPCWKSKEAETEHIIATKNGLVDLEPLIYRGKPPALLPHTPDFFVLSSLPYEYNPKAKCLRWQKFLDDALSIDPDLSWIMQEFYGLCLTHDTRWHHFLFIQGESRTGKGVAFEVLQALVGYDNVANVPLRQFGETFGLQPLIGKKLNMNAEVPELDEVAEDILKEYCGGSTMLSINRKNRQALSTRQRARLAFSSNHLPHFRDRSEGIWHRMLLIPFTRVVPEAERNPDLAEELIEEELPGIFNWAMEGYQRLIQNKGFTDSATMRISRDEYREETTPVRRFLSECTINVPGEEVTTRELYDLYVIWAKAEGHARQSSVSFARDTAAFFRNIEGVEKQRDGKKGRWYEGVTIDPHAKEELATRTTRT